MHTGEILIVDDNFEAAEMLQMLLSLEEHTVVTAQSAEDALSKIEEFTPQVIISDIRMPGMSGLELARKIRLSSVEKNLLIATTGWSDRKTLDEVKQSGYDAVFVKPVPYEDLSKAIQAYLSKQKQIA